MPRFTPNAKEARQITYFCNIKEIEMNHPEENAEELPVTINDFFKKKWKVFRVSPLHNFSKDKLKLYENQLLQELNSLKRNNLNKSYRNVVIFMEKLIVNQQSNEVLKVKITENNSENIYLGYLISSNYSEIDNATNFKSLPVLLVKAKNQISQEVNLGICKIFDCDIQPVTFSFHTLITFLVKILENPTKNEDASQEIMHLEFKIPGCSIGDKIKVTLMLEEVTIIFAVVIDHLREKIPGISNMEIIIEFYSRIINHIYNTYKLDLMLAELHKVIFPHALITRDGQLKFSKDNDAGEVLNILQKTCLPVQQF